MRQSITLGIIATLAVAAVATAGESRTIEGRASLAVGQEVRIDFPVGELEVVGVAGDEFRITIEGRCKRHSSRCADHLDDIEVDIHESRGVIWVEVAPHSKWRWWNSLEIEAQVQHPRDRPLSIDMGVGELEVEGTLSDLEIDLGVGEVTVDVPVAVVGTVTMDAGIGETELLVPAGWVRDERSFLVGSESSWRDGSGSARINVEVGVGEGVVRLDG